MQITFPDNFDPLAASDCEIAQLVRRLWTDAQCDAIQAEVEQLDRESAEMDAAMLDLNDTFELTEANLDLHHHPE